jgi:hypothetical protein
MRGIKPLKLAIYLHDALFSTTFCIKKKIISKKFLKLLEFYSSFNYCCLLRPTYFQDQNQSKKNYREAINTEVDAKEGFLCLGPFSCLKFPFQM